ncbi:acylneuraminate cytidylyltransferase family protein [Desulfobacula toluolica]|uniref:N-acylneuraminate cytidylyltransferase n=1 Tax=Desulfobacula toluolica (strain DSM 7467 / Tol2) TaxID=651182 RepID=K0NH57_DESTT|nr:acylneuraminate cytidylyltransferase family protein [Desulfobacula toluolica]CCK80305.1 N-acylneuraminate cytidylyltransferase [Desulfobacula toluolica Tol2]
MIDKRNFKLDVLLPMKAHSERVPNKNFKIFIDRPLYHWVTSTLEKSDYIKTIWINTDSDFIAKDAVKNFKKVKIINRPEHLRGDFVSMNKIIDHDINMIKSEHFIQTHSTNPLLKRETLEKSINHYFENLSLYDSLFSVTKIQSRFYTESMVPFNHDPNELKRTQDLQPLYEENSNIYIFSKQSFNDAGKKRVGIKPNMFIIDKLESIDIDNENDWKIAELIAKYNIGNLQ